MYSFILFVFYLGFVQANVRVQPGFIEVECERHYERINNTVCDTTMLDMWNENSDAQGTFAAMTLEQGRDFADRRCEEACARTNACRGYAVSKASSYECRVFYDCALKKASDQFDLFLRQAPFNCFIKVTSFDGVFQNFGEQGGQLSQFARLVRVDTNPFQEVHVSINGVTNKTAFAYRPYKDVGKQYCGMEEDVLNCILMNAGEVSVIFFFCFVVILSWNTFLILGVVSRHLDT